MKPSFDVLATRRLCADIHPTVRQLRPIFPALVQPAPSTHRIENSTWAASRLFESTSHSCIQIARPQCDEGPMTHSIQVVAK